MLKMITQPIHTAYTYMYICILYTDSFLHDKKEKQEACMGLFLQVPSFCAEIRSLTFGLTRLQALILP